MQKNQKIQMNDSIRAHELRILGPENENWGVMTKVDAIKKAKSLGVDIILVAENAVPPVAKIIDYGKYAYLENKKNNQKRADDNSTETKVLRMTVGIGEGDLTVKAKQASLWLSEGHRVKIELKLKGRANAIEQNFLKERLQRVLILLTENYKMAEPIKKIPNGMTMVIEKSKGKRGSDDVAATAQV
jgi:translation initiation factor IF-3